MPWKEANRACVAGVPSKGYSKEIRKIMNSILRSIHLYVKINKYIVQTPQVFEDRAY